MAETATQLTAEEFPCKTASCLLSPKLQILKVLSFDPEIIYLLLLVIAKLDKKSVCPFKIVSFFLSKRFHIIIEQSREPETMYLLSLETAMLVTNVLWPCKDASCFFSKKSQIRTVLS